MTEMLRTIFEISSARLIGISSRVFHQKVGLEADEIFLVLMDECLEFFRIMFAGEGVRVVSVRKQAYFDVHAFFQQHIDSADRGFDTGYVTVIEYGNVIGETVDQTNLSQASLRCPMKRLRFLCPTDAWR